MRPTLLGVLILLACASECAAHGSIAYGYDAANRIRFVASQNEPAAINAQIVAFEQCRAEGLANCTALTGFENSCKAIAITPAGPYNLGTGRDVDEARRVAMSACQTDRRVACSVALFVCDGTPAPEPDAEPHADTPTINLNWFGPAFWRGLQIEIGAVLMATVISCALALWMFVSMVSATPVAALKRRAAISAWIALPAVIAYPIYKLSFQPWLRGPNLVTIADNVVTFLLLWPSVFVALVIGGADRGRLFRPARVPDPLSLPLAVLAFTVVTAGVLKLFIRLGTFPNFLGCGSPPYPSLGACSYFEYEGFCVGAAWLILLFICGLALPPDSNLILGYDRLKALLRRSRLAASRPPQDALVATAGGYPLPAVLAQSGPLALQDISVGLPSGPMILKIRKSQISNVWGTPVFIVDARMELSAEERFLVEKYRLGDLMIYSSSARSRHKEAAKAHLEGTKGHPVFTLRIRDQVMGVLKTFFRLGMAGAHAAMAAYHLKITVYKLMRGVHVRCKDMDEVLLARGAIVDAAANLRIYLDAALSFDGTEEILEF